MGVKYHFECVLAERFRVFPKSVPRRGGVSPGAIALLRVRFRSSRRLAGLTPCVSLTQSPQTALRTAQRTRRALSPAPSHRLWRLDRAETSVTGSRTARGISRTCSDGLASPSVMPGRMWACLCVARLSHRAHRQGLRAWLRLVLASVCHTALTAALSVWRRPSTQAISLVTIRRK